MPINLRLRKVQAGHRTCKPFASFGTSLRVIFQPLRLLFTLVFRPGGVVDVPELD
jgi:hypothetical protein